MEKHFGPEENVSRGKIEKEINNLLASSRVICDRITEGQDTLLKTIELKDCYGLGARCFELKEQALKLCIYSDRIETLRTLLYKQ